MFRHRGNSLSAGALGARARESREGRAGSPAPGPGSPHLSFHDVGAGKAPGDTESASSLTDARPRALEQKGLDRVQTVLVSGPPPDDEISFPISSLPALGTAPPPRPQGTRAWTCQR